MHVLIIGLLSGALAQAGRIAMKRGARLAQADDIDAALSGLRANAQFDLVLCEVSQDISRLIAALMSERMVVPVVACGIDTDPLTAAHAIRAGAREFLPLPPDPDLIAAILQAAAGDAPDIIAKDPTMLATLRRADQVAASPASVLITGESGTGKEVLARYIHNRSRRSSGPFVAMNCAAIPENLLESELFGHEKGAFSGAIARRIGRFEAAEGGTLLLDEISEMDIRLQAKLLRALQERTVDRVGGTAPVKIDVRILATTNRNLEDAVASSQFREDLWFRLNVITLRLPALRERPGDIPSLAIHFVRHYADVNGLPMRALSPNALSKLQAYRWRGNVRELENVLHRAVLLAEGTEIGPEAIEVGEPSLVTGIGIPTNGGMNGLVGRRMNDVERDLIIETLHHTLGNRTHAATILGISIRALRNKLRDYTALGVTVPPPGAGAAA